MAFDHNRKDLGLDPVVRSTSGSPRPKIAPVDTFVVHYVGAGYAFLDHGDSRTEIRSIDAYASGAGKPNEYNSFSDSEGVTWEYAGPYRAAHSKGDNGTSWGHCVLIGLSTPTAADLTGLVKGIRRARQQAVDAGWLTPNHKVRQHKQMPGGKQTGTNCPGPALCAPDVWAQIEAPLNGEVSEPDKPTEPTGTPKPMIPLKQPRRILDTRRKPLGNKAEPDQIVTVNVGATQAFVHVTAVDAEGVGYVAVSGTDKIGDVSLLNLDVDRAESGGAPVGLPDGKVRVMSTARTHLIVDVYAE